MEAAARAVPCGAKREETGGETRQVAKILAFVCSGKLRGLNWLSRTPKNGVRDSMACAENFW